MENNKKFNRLKDLNTNSVEDFYTQVKNAVAFAENNNPMSEDEKRAISETFEIMKGSKNPLSEKEKIIHLACSYGFINSIDLVTLVQNDASASSFLQS